MSIYITFFASVFAAFTVYLLLGILDCDNKLSMKRLWILVILLSIIITVLNDIEAPARILSSIMIYALCFTKFSGNQMLNVLMDVLLASGTYIALQLISMLVMQKFYGSIMDNYVLLFVMHTFFVCAVYGLGRLELFDKFVRKYYLRNRNLIIWIVLNLFLAMVVISQIYGDKEFVFWEERKGVMVLVGIIYLLNSVLLISFLRRKKQESKLLAYQEYDEYLEGLMHQISGRQHEFANQINVIMGLAQTKKGDDLSKAIMEYGERILDEKKKAAAQTIFCDDSMISAMLYQKKIEAEREVIQFDCLIENPFPGYSVSPYDLVELAVNLINNAFEAVASMEPENRQVFLKMNAGKIEVINAVPLNFDETLVAMFRKKGYSTKGEKRGYGISNITAIVERYNGTLDIYTQEKMIVFSVLLP